MLCLLYLVPVVFLIVPIVLVHRFNNKNLAYMLAMEVELRKTNLAAFLKVRRAFGK